MTLNSLQWKALKQGFVPSSSGTDLRFSKFCSLVVKVTVFASIGIAGVFAVQGLRSADSEPRTTRYSDYAIHEVPPAKTVRTVNKPSRFPRIHLHKLSSAEPGVTPSLWRALEGVHDD